MIARVVVLVLAALFALQLAAVVAFVVRRAVRRARDSRRYRKQAEEGARITLQKYRSNCVCTIEGVPFDESADYEERADRAREVRKVVVREVRKADRRRLAMRRRDDKRKAALRQ
jgi:hypothetical protein